MGSSPWTTAKVGFYAPMELRELNLHFQRPRLPYWRMRLDFPDWPLG